MDPPVSSDTGGELSKGRPAGAALFVLERGIRGSTWEQQQCSSTKHRFITALQMIPRFEVRLGKLAFRGRDGNGAPIFVQKRVDNMVGVDMALLAGKGKITNVALLTGDSDYMPSIEAVKREGVLVTLLPARSYAM